MDQRESGTCSRRGDRALSEKLSTAIMAGGGGGGGSPAGDREQDAGSSGREEMEGR